MLRFGAHSCNRGARLQGRHYYLSEASVICRVNCCSLTASWPVLVAMSAPSSQEGAKEPKVHRIARIAGRHLAFSRAPVDMENDKQDAE